MQHTARIQPAAYGVADQQPAIEVCLKAGLLKAYSLPPVLQEADSKFQRLLDALAAVKLDGQRED